MLLVNIIFYCCGEWPYNSSANQTQVEVHSIRPRRNLMAKSTPYSLCGSSAAHRGFSQFCIPKGRSAVITIPLNTLVYKGQQASKYKTYPLWYITNDQKDTSWSTLIADPLGYDWRRYTTTAFAKHMRPLVKLDKIADKVLLTVNLTKSDLLPLKYLQNGQACILFIIWVYKGGKRCSISYYNMSRLS